MPGIAGIIGPESCGPEECARNLDRMAAALLHREDYRVRRWTSASAAFASVSIGDRHPVVQVASGARRYVLLVDGYVYRIGGKPVERANEDLAETAGEDLVTLATSAPPGGLVDIEGNYSIAIYDEEAGELQLFNDIIGPRRLYYAVVRGSFVFAPEVKAICRIPGFEPDLDWKGIADFMNYGYVLGEETYFAGIKSLPSATVLRFRRKDGAADARRYWRPRYSPGPGTLESFAEEAGTQVARSVAEKVRRGESVVCPISGGLDSRLILATLSGLDKDLRITPLTFGQRGSTEYVNAKQVCRALGRTGHRLMEISPDALLDQYRRAVWRSEGMLAMTNAHLLLISGFLGGGHQCYLNGIYGGPTNYSAEYYAERHLTDAFSFDEKVRDICDVIAVAPSLYRPACGEALVARLERARTASVARELEKQLDVSDRFCDQRDALLIENRMRRFICQGALYRFAWEEQLPLSNYGLYRFYLGTPPEFKLYRRLLKATLTGSWPALAAIRDSNTGLNLYQTTGRWREFRINMQTRLRYYVARASFGRLTVLDRSTYAHYSDWFRSHSGTYRFFTQQVTAPWLQELVGSTRPALLDFAGGVRRRGWGFEHLVRLATLGVWYQVFVLGNGARPPEEDGGPARPTPKEESAPWK